MPNPDSNSPLSGLRVLGFGSFIAGPMAGQILADMGADVIKIEPIEGEPWRHHAEFMPGESRVFLPLNRGVRSVCLDLRKPEAQAALTRIVRTADAAISNHRPDTAVKLKIDYESLSKVNPKLVYVEVTGYGHKGPRGDMPGFDLIMQGFAGVVTSEGKITAGHQPEVVWSSSFIDFSTAYAAAGAVMAGMIARQRTGKGQKCETSLFANALNMQCMRVVRLEGKPTAAQKWHEEDLPQLKAQGASYEEQLDDYKKLTRTAIYRTYYRAYRTRDGALCLGTLAVPARLRLLEFFGLKDPRVQQPGFDEESEAGRQVAVEVQAEFERRFAEQPTDYWFRELRARDIPCEPVRYIEEMPFDEQALANDYVITLDHADGFRFTTPGPIIRFSGGMPERKSSPALGQHTENVLADVGYSQSEIAALIRSGAAR